MTNKSEVQKAQDVKKSVKHPGMMGDGTEEQNLNEKGDPQARITESEAEEAFGIAKSKRKLPNA